RPRLVAAEVDAARVDDAVGIPANGPDLAEDVHERGRQEADRERIEAGELVFTAQGGITRGHAPEIDVVDLDRHPVERPGARDDLPAVVVVVKAEIGRVLHELEARVDARARDAAAEVEAV